DAGCPRALVRQIEWLAQGIEMEEVPVRLVADRRMRPAPADLSEVVAPLPSAARHLTLSHPVAVRVDAGHEPVQKRAAGSVWVLAHQHQFGGALRHARPLQRRGCVSGQEHTSELQSRENIVCRLRREKTNTT